jgi:hypothetical protein
VQFVNRWLARLQDDENVFDDFILGAVHHGYLYYLSAALHTEQSVSDLLLSSAYGCSRFCRRDVVSCISRVSRVSAVLQKHSIEREVISHMGPKTSACAYIGSLHVIRAFSHAQQ